MMGGHHKPICPETDEECERGCKVGSCFHRTMIAARAQTVGGLHVLREPVDDVIGGSNDRDTKRPL
jgi:hypothetical protein